MEDNLEGEEIQVESRHWASQITLAQLQSISTTFG